jgi:hypothetical protein
MSINWKRFVIGLVILVVVCLASSLMVYRMLFPAPLAVINQIEEDFPKRGGPSLIVTTGPLGSPGILEQLFPSDREIYTYEIVEVNERDPLNDKYHLLILDEATKALCVTTLVTYIPPFDSFLPQGRKNPEYFNYLAEKVDGEWSILFLDNRVGTCG